MITGHTHELKLYEENNILYLNPGSLTGARTVVNTGKKEHIPSFMLLDVNQTNIVIYIYKLINDKGNLADVRNPWTVRFYCMEYEYYTI